MWRVLTSVTHVELARIDISIASWVDLAARVELVCCLGQSAMSSWCISNSSPGLTKLAAPIELAGVDRGAWVELAGVDLPGLNWHVLTLLPGSNWCMSTCA
jgi:hypothetical protein